MNQDTTRKYGPPPGVVSPGSSLVASMRRTLPVRTLLEKLFDATGHTVSMGVLNRTNVAYLHRLYGHRTGRSLIDQELRLGAYVPLYCTALGKAILASLPADERRQLVLRVAFIPQGPRSYVAADDLLAEIETLDPREPVISDEEFMVGARSIAIHVPRPHDEQPIAIDVTVPSDAFTVQQLIEQIGPRLKYTARRISQIERSELCPQ